MKTQVIVIHGGSAYNTYDEYIKDLKETSLDLTRQNVKGWKDTLPNELGPNFEVLAPEMPNWWNAKYLEWRIWFEKVLEIVQDDAIFLGHSLGGVFLAKYFAENTYNKKIRSIFLISSPDGSSGLGSFKLPKNVSYLRTYGSKIHLYHSNDDEVVPYSQFEAYQKALPDAQVHIFKDRGHFNQITFPEIIEEIKK